MLLDIAIVIVVVVIVVVVDEAVAAFVGDGRVGGRICVGIAVPGN